MKIGLRGGHSPNCKGAIGILDEQLEVRKIYNALTPLLKGVGYTVIDCNSNASNVTTELAEGTSKANKEKCDMYITIHMNASSGGVGHGTEVWLYSNGNEKMNKIAASVCENFASEEFTNRGVRYNTGLHDLNASEMPAMIIETLFCDNADDAACYKKLGVDAVARLIGNAIDSRISLSGVKSTASTSKVINATIQSNSGANYQRLIFEDAGNGMYRIKDKANGYYMTAASPVANGNIDFRPKTGGNSQLWKMTKRKKGYADYTMFSPAENQELYLSIEKNGIGKNNVKLWTDLDNSKQFFWLRQETDGTVMLVHVYTAKTVSAKA